MIEICGIIFILIVYYLVGCYFMGVADQFALPDSEFYENKFGLEEKMITVIWPCYLIFSIVVGTLVHIKLYIQSKKKNDCIGLTEKLFNLGKTTIKHVSKHNG